MKTKLFLIMALLGILTSWLMAQQPGWNWATQSAGDPSVYNFGNDRCVIGTDSQSNLIFAGRSNSRVFLDDTILGPSTNLYPPPYLYLWKQDPSSNTIFVRQFESMGLTPFSISCDANNNIYLWVEKLGTTIFEGIEYSGQYCYLLIKLDPLGNIIWVLEHFWGRLSVNESGYCVIGGSFEGTLTIGTYTFQSEGRQDMYISKISPDGVLLWAKSYGTSTNDCCYHTICLDNGETFICGRVGVGCDFDGMLVPPNGGAAIFVAKLDNNGTCIWIRKVYDFYPDSNYEFYECSIASNDPNVLYIHYQRGVYYNPPDERTIVVVRYDVSETWGFDIYSFPTANDVRRGQMIIDDEGDLYLTGYYYDPFILGDYSFVWERGCFVIKLDIIYDYMADVSWIYDQGEGSSDIFLPWDVSLCVSNQGALYYRVYAYGGLPIPPFQAYPGVGTYVLKFSYTGTPVWMCSNWIYTIGTEAKDIWRTTSGDAFVCGNFEGDSFWGNTYLKNRGNSSTDIFVTRFDSANLTLWTACAGGEGNQEVSAIYTDSYLCSHVTGKFSGSMQFGDITIQSSGAEDIYVAKLDEQGNWLWAFAAGGQGNDAGLDVVADNAGNVYACGYFTGAANFGIDDLEAQGATDGFVVKLNSIGTCINAVQSNAEGADQATALVIDNLDRLWLGNNAVPESNFPEAQRITINRLSLSLDTLDSLSSNTAEDLCLCGLALDNSNNCYLIGTYRDELNFGSHSLTQQPNISAFVMGIDSNLQTLWANNATSWNPVVPKAIIADDNGNCYIAGSIKEGGWFGSISVNGWGENDIFVAKLNSSGAWTWAKTNGSTLDDCATGIALKQNGLCSVVGRFDGRIGLGNYWLEPMSQYDSFLAELSYGSETPEELVISPVPGMLSAYPNPFKNELKISCETTEPADLKVNIYNLKGQLVRTLHSSSKTAGLHSLTWDGMDSHQNRCAAGVYLLRTQGTKTQLTQKVVKLKE